jgi:hypothetical protein
LGNASGASALVAWFRRGARRLSARFGFALWCPDQPLALVLWEGPSARRGLCSMACQKPLGVRAYGIAIPNAAWRDWKRLTSLQIQMRVESKH